MNGEGRPSFTIRPARAEDVPAIREMMIDIFEHDFGYGYRPEYHADVDDLDGVYIATPRHTMLVAVDDATGAIAATAGVRSGGLKPEFNHAWLVARYDPERTAQLVRVYVARAYRRHGLARRLVDEAVRFVAQAPGYDTLSLHTDPRSPGAEAFWRAMPTRLILDDRDGPSASLHFEMDIPAPGERGEEER